MTFIERSLPPPDRDDAPQFPLAPTPSLTDDLTADRIATLGRALTEANKEFFEFLRSLALNDPVTRDSALARCATHLTEAGPLSRILSKSFHRAAVIREQPKE